MHLVSEADTFTTDAAENTAMTRVAQAWNRIHKTLATQPEGTVTSQIEFNQAFFVINGDHCVVIEGVKAPTSALTEDQINEGIYFENIEGQSADDLNELATAMETWLERPIYKRLNAATTSINLDDAPDDALSPGY